MKLDFATLSIVNERFCSVKICDCVFASALHFIPKAKKRVGGVVLAKHSNGNASTLEITIETAGLASIFKSN